MLNFSRTKVWLITLTCLVGVLLAVPSLLPANITANWPHLLRPHVNLGLDLAGGSQLLLEADTSSLSRQRLEAQEDGIRAELRRNNIDVASVSTANNLLTVTVRDPAQRDAALSLARNIVRNSSGQAEWDVNPAEANQLVLRSTGAGDQAAIETAMSGAREVIDRRINALGTLEPTIIKQGATRILVQVPGLQDPQALRALIGRTARLEFKLLAENITQEQMASGRAPPGTQILPRREGGTVAVQRRAMITGDQIASASQSYDENGRPDVTINFDSTGGTRFAKVTRENVGKPFAIILDNVVLSSPGIREPILGGRASISGGFTVQEATDLAISLNSGRLPVELRVVEERSVGPDLGADSIRAGVLACAIATIAVLILMFLCYGRFGVYANLAVLINLFVIVGVMAVMNATLTLPGIAGFVLTIGTAVDANVLINERIREERRRGRTVIMAIENGYKEASRTIFEANVIHTISAVIMLLLGSGPIKGFAIVLLIGIVTSVFTAVVFTRMMIALWLRRHKPADLHI